MYTEPDFSTKRDLKSAITRQNRYNKLRTVSLGSDVSLKQLIDQEFPDGPPTQVIVFYAGMKHKSLPPQNGRIYIESREHPVWSAYGMMEDGVLIEVK